MTVRPCTFFTLSLLLGACADATAGPEPRAPSALRELDEEVGVSATPPVRRAPPVFEDANPSALRLFDEVLAPYGEWVDDARLGLVWSPSHDEIGDGFVPYATHGRWTHRTVPTTSGEVDEFVWVSDLPWGWVTFHYGRWAYVADRGWVWIAGRRYAGAWVDWRIPDRGASEVVVGWGPTPPSHVWRVAPGPRPTRAWALGAGSRVRDARVFAVPYAAFATPYGYVRARDLFAPDRSTRMLSGPAALAVAHATEPGAPPRPRDLGFTAEQVPAPPVLDRGLQQAWMLATPASALAVGAGPELGSPPRLRTWVAGGPRWAVLR